MKVSVVSVHSPNRYVTLLVTLEKSTQIRRWGTTSLDPISISAFETMLCILLHRKPNVEFDETNKFGAFDDSWCRQVLNQSATNDVACDG